MASYFQKVMGLTDAMASVASHSAMRRSSLTISARPDVPSFSEVYCLFKRHDFWCSELRHAPMSHSLRAS
jgi:hypothetical protein